MGPGCVVEGAVAMNVGPLDALPQTDARDIGKEEEDRQAEPIR